MKNDDRNSEQVVTWHDMLKDSLSMIDVKDLIDPDGDVDDNNETVLGVAPLTDQRLFTYAERLEEQSTRMLVDARYSREGSREKERLIKRSFEMSCKSALVRDILWANLKDQFDAWAPHLFIGLRKGFVVVSGNRGREK